MSVEVMIVAMVVVVFFGILPIHRYRPKVVARRLAHEPCVLAFRLKRES